MLVYICRTKSQVIIEIMQMKRNKLRKDSEYTIFLRVSKTVTLLNLLLVKSESLKRELETLREISIKYSFFKKLMLVLPLSLNNQRTNRVLM